MLLWAVKRAQAACVVLSLLWINKLKPLCIVWSVVCLSRRRSFAENGSLRKAELGRDGGFFPHIATWKCSKQCWVYISLNACHVLLGSVIYSVQTTDHHASMLFGCRVCIDTHVQIQWSQSIKYLGVYVVSGKTQSFDVSPMKRAFCATCNCILRSTLCPKNIPSNHQQ